MTAAGLFENFEMEILQWNILLTLAIFLSIFISYAKVGTGFNSDVRKNFKINISYSKWKRYVRLQQGGEHWLKIFELDFILDLFGKLDMQIFFSDFYTIQPALWKNISVQILSSALLNSSLTQLLLVHTNQSSTAYRLD